MGVDILRDKTFTPFKTCVFGLFETPVIDSKFNFEWIEWFWHI